MMNKIKINIYSGLIGLAAGILTYLVIYFTAIVNWIFYLVFTELFGDIPYSVFVFDIIVSLSVSILVAREYKKSIIKKYNQST